MKSFEYVIQDELGLHARPAGLVLSVCFGVFLVRTRYPRQKLNLSMMLMSMGAKRGATITVTVEGEDEDVACAAIEKFFRENL